MQLLLRDRVFPIIETSLTGYLADPYWSRKWNRGVVPLPGLAIELKAGEREFDGDYWSPMLYNEELRFPSRNWRDIAGRRLSWSGAGDDGNGPPGALYIWEHASLQANELVFGARDGTDFDITWRGLYDIFWSEPYGQAVPFSATAKAAFTQIVLNGSEHDNEQSYRARFTEHFDPDDFEQQPIVRPGHCYDDGTPISSCTFRVRVG